MSTGGYNPTPPPNYNDSQTQQYGFKPPAYNPDMPVPAPVPAQPPAPVTVIQAIDFERKNFKRRRQKSNTGEGSSNIFMKKTGKSEKERKVEGPEENLVPQAYGPDAQHVTCPSCRATITTKVQHENSTKTHIICLIMCIVGLWPCCLIPYCVDSCKNANHYCPSCNSFLGTYKG